MNIPSNIHGMYKEQDVMGLNKAYQIFCRTYVLPVDKEHLMRMKAYIWFSCNRTHSTNLKVLNIAI